MPTVKIDDIPGLCVNPDHNHDKTNYYPPGIYNHTCPNCKQSYVFTVGMEAQRPDNVIKTK